MNREGDAVALHALEAGVVDLDRLVERPLRVDTHLVLDVAAPFGIDVVGVARRVDLDVLHAFADQRLNLLLHDRDDVPQEIGIARVDAIADAFLVGDRGKLIRCRQRHLDVAGRVLRHEVDFVPGQPPRLPQPGDDRAAGRADAFGDHRRRGGALPGAVDLELAVEPFDRLVEVAHEAGAAQLAVGEDREAGVLLPLQDVEDTAIFDHPQLVGRDGRIPARVEQLLRPQQAADVICAVLRWHVASSLETTGSCQPIGRLLRNHEDTKKNEERGSAHPQFARPVATGAPPLCDVEKMTCSDISACSGCAPASTSGPTCSLTRPPLPTEITSSAPRRGCALRPYSKATPSRSAITRSRSSPLCRTSNSRRLSPYASAGGCL